ncbi:MAG: alpha/beta hydrolase [candidate division Zixibacteria bacterium]|nr:alpha/beta hydrolase [candidate division Zixibacteria bacterium]MDH3936648.1 alpha/beta hydrolase [candidate division Zixibacteria bacterium]MDH4035466.1 alpha/beta hydrolase [candidate division Zixibacteria bacterium]
MKLSKQTREIINMVIFVLVAALLFVTYVIYPLNRTKAVMGRDNVDDYYEDSLEINDPAAWIDSGLIADSFTVEADGLTTLACLYVLPDSAVHDSILGTVFFLHHDNADRDSMLSLARQMSTAGYSVVAYDQRAAGRSTGQYHGEGQYEATDLEEVIRWLDLRKKIHHPLAIVGFGLGGDAAILVAREDARIDKVMAVNPYLTSERMLRMLKDRHDTYWFPFYYTMMWWWYGIRSGYAAPYREIEAVEAVACQTLLLTGSESGDDPEVVILQELSSDELLKVESATLSGQESSVADRVWTFVTRE